MLSERLDAVCIFLYRIYLFGVQEEHTVDLFVTKIKH